MTAPVDTLQARRAYSEALARKVRLSAERPLYIGRYSIHDLIGVGGMATVHLGRLHGAADFTRTVAIKRLLPQYADDSEFGALFMREVKLASRVHHPNVVTTLDALSQDGELILVMEYVEGETLFRLLFEAARVAAVPQPVVLRVVADALRGLAAVHQAKGLHGGPLGMVHRDVSPHNLMVGVDGVTRLMDFGIAKAAESVDATRTGVVRGKASYVSPEQLLKHPLSQRSDLYAIGVVAWEALVGERLFPQGNRMEMLQKIAGEVPRPRQRNPLVSEALDAVVMRAIAPKEADRFDSAESMIHALQSCALEASPEEVGDWVKRAGREGLNKRRAIVARVESAALEAPSSASELKAAPVVTALGSFTGPVAATPTKGPASQRPLRPERSWWPMASMAAAVLALLLVLAYGQWSDHSVLLWGAPQGPLPTAPNAVDVPSGTRSAQDVTASASRATKALPGPTEPQPGSRGPSSDGAIATTPPTSRALQPEPTASAGGRDFTRSTTSSRPLALEREQRRPRGRSLSQPAGASDRSRTKPASCTPPYRVDAAGHRHYKPECF